ncbi:MAG: 3-isopropylmalate dehydratase large subunit, partial [Anaerolineales bacterium]|nr:3-isopropylmalate dehydratase large subunit [Anaerolineales bacterium]
MAQPKTIIDKIWENHIVTQEPGSPAVLYIDLHLVHEVTSPQAFQGLRDRGLQVRRPSQTIATMDHSIPTTPIGIPIQDVIAAKQIATMEKNCRDFGIRLFGMDSPNRGIVHVIGPEQGLTQPGMTIVCGDSHTATHGAFGALAFGIGTSEVEHVLATQCLLQTKPKTYAVNVNGRLSSSVTSKDIILALLAKIGVGGGTGHVFEYRGDAIRSLTMEQRMTICNMSIEGGARAGLVAPDDTTFAYIAGRPRAPKGAAWETAVAEWRKLPSDEGAQFDKEVDLDANALEPMITYGTNPGMGMKISDTIPDPMKIGNLSERQTIEKSLAYM